MDFNGHEPDIKNGNKQKTAGQHFNSPEHSTTGLKVVVLQQNNSKKRIQHAMADLEFISRLNTIKLELSKLFVSSNCVCTDLWNCSVYFAIVLRGGV